MATVYLAEDLRHHRRVAIKVLRPQLAESLGAERFRREIEIAAGLHHPHILPLFDSGEADGLLFYVMPFETGQTLRGRLEDAGRLPVPLAIRIMVEVADALRHAHGEGVVHRDIKPENVLLSDHHALVTDFGIAKALAGSRLAEPTGEQQPQNSLTQVGTSIGTPTYMAPEQITGDTNIDHRADIYALGLLAYEMLAGEPPFQGETSQQVIAAHLTQEPTPLGTLRGDIPPRLAAIIARCLAKDPADRWQSVEEMIPPLEALSTGSGATPGRRRWPIALAATIVGVALLGFFWLHQEGRYGTLIGRDVLAADDLVMVAEFVNRTPDSTLSATVTDAVRIELEESPVVKVLSQRDMWAGMERMEVASGSVLSDVKLHELAERVGAKAFVTGDVASLGAGYQLTARVVTSIDGQENLLVRTTAANDAGLIAAVGELTRKLRRGIGESLRSVAAAPALAIATTSSLPALKAFTAGQRAEVAGDRDQAIALFRQAIVLDSAFAHAWAALGVAYTNNSWNRQAREAMTHAHALSANLPESSRLAIAHNYYLTIGQFDSAQAVLLRRTALHDEGWVSLADLYLSRGNLVEAEAAARRGIIEKPRGPVAYWNLAEAQIGQQKFTAADSTIATLLDTLSGNAWGVELGGAQFAARHEFDSLAAYLTTGAGSTQDPGVIAEQRCGIDFMAGRLAAFRRCTAPSPVDGGAGDPPQVLAELRLPGDSARARRAMAAITAAPADTLNSFFWPSAVVTFAELGMVTEARAALARWQRNVGVDDPRYKVDLPYALAALMMAEAKFDSAATLFLAWNRSGSPDATHWFNRGLVEAGMALDRAGQSDSTRVLYQRALELPSITGGMYYEAAWYPGVLHRLGQLAEARGDTATALKRYGALSRLWQHADPELRRQVDALHQRIAALSRDAAVP